jgi:succinyl-CoA synthetase beta subunit
MAAAKVVGGSVVVKAQVLAGGRGKAGGVRFAGNPEEARQAAHDIFAMRINGIPVQRVLVAEALQTEREYYISLAIDRKARCVRCIMSASGGMDIEQVARDAPDTILGVQLPPFSQTKKFENKEALIAVFGDRDVAAAAADAISSMIRLMSGIDCLLVEVNPFILTKDNRFEAADTKIVIDDNALYKHPELEPLRNDQEYTGEELAARRAGLSFVGLDGSIGCMVNGAGLAMATMDMIQVFGARPANFLDVGGSSNPQKVLDAFRILLSSTSIRVILVNIFGGITRCDDIATGIILAKQALSIRKPMVVRLTGTNEDQGREMLAAAGITAERDMIAAVKRAVALQGAAA